jgi:hypothetical protein
MACNILIVRRGAGSKTLDGLVQLLDWDCFGQVSIVGERHGQLGLSLPEFPKLPGVVVVV